MTPPIDTSKEGEHVLLLEGIHTDAAQRFRSAGYHVEELSSSLAEDQLIERIRDVTVLGLRSKTQVTRNVIESAPKLAAVGAFCIGTNQIDLEACLARGIPVFNAPFANTRSVVEMALGEIIVLYRHIPEKNNLLHQGTWKKRSHGAREIRGKKLGIIGYGNIGAQLSILAEAVGMDVYYYDVTEKLALGNATPCRTLTELLETVDVVTVHVDGRPENHNFIGADEFETMKEDAVFLNLSRGFVVDQDALRSALERGKIRAAAIDVFPEEPKTDGTSFESPLQGLPNVILTPHIGGSTEEAQENIGYFVPDKLMNFLEKGNTTLSVNFPNLQLPEFKGSHRIVHVHRNVPGILAKINKVFADRGINITGQYLKTGEGIGYVITDIVGEEPADLTRELTEIPDTIRVRVLY